VRIALLAVGCSGLSILGGCSCTAPVAPTDAVLVDGGQDVGELPDTMPSIESGLDAAPPDAGFDAPRDAGFDAPLDDGGFDASELPDVPLDTACTCDPRACQIATCLDALCTYLPVDDGTPCVDAFGEGLCTAGTCAPLPVICGDGRRELGKAREACDDGNDLPGDACNACMPTGFDASEVGGITDVPPGPRPGVGVNGRGWAAYVWTSDPRTTGREVRMRIFDAGGVPVGVGSTLIASGVALPEDPGPAVVGLASGWVVAWYDSDVDGSAYGIGYVMVGADGSVGPTRIANSITSFSQEAPAIAATGTGFVMAWNDGSRISSGVISRVMMRRFDAAGTPLAPEEIVEVERRRSSWPALAVSPSGTILVSWVDRGTGVSDVWSVRARRHDGTRFVDAASLVIDAGESGSPAVATLEAGGFVVAWSAYTTDFGGDVLGVLVPEAGPVGAPMVIAGDPVIDELNPSVVGLEGSSFLVAHSVGRVMWAGGEGVDMVAVPPSAFPAEAYPMLSAMQLASLGQWSFVRGRSPDGRAEDRRIWASYGVVDFAGPTRMRSVGGYLFSPE
jgi:cysteine-rich repeat protein